MVRLYTLKLTNLREGAQPKWVMKERHASTSPLIDTRPRQWMALGYEGFPGDEQTEGHRPLRVGLFHQAGMIARIVECAHP
jgi:hypothetical protein